MKESAVKVGVCVCPLSEEEKENETQAIISYDDNEIKVSMGEGRGHKSYEIDLKPFNLDSDGISVTVSEVSKSIGDILIKQAFSGYNGTVFTYGAKSTYKSTVVYGKRNEVGLIDYTLEGLFSMANDCEDDVSFRCEISFFEICGEMITDLISKRENVKSSEGVVKLKVKEEPSKGIYVDKLSRHIVTDVPEASSLFNKGVKNRKRLAALDPESKETSHSIFSITFTQAKLTDGMPMELVSKINIIDLASRDGYSGNMNGFHNVLNLSEEEISEIEEQRGPLEVLNDVINALAGQNYGSINPVRSYGAINPKRSYGSIHGATSGIPYEDSVRMFICSKKGVFPDVAVKFQNLTLFMKDALGGNVETIMLCCISSSSKCLRDTLNTLKYGNLARHIKNKPVVNEDQNVKLIRELKDEITVLKKKQKQTTSEGKSKEQLRKIKRDEELMNRLTGIWEEKWSKAQQMIEDKSLNLKDIGGTGLKLETKEPHFVSLGGGRLSVGVSIIPINKGFTRIGCGGEGYDVDLMVRGQGIASEHCLVEFDGDAVVLHPKNELVSVDGIPLVQPTRLTQGAVNRAITSLAVILTYFNKPVKSCMICIGRNTYFRFNHPNEAAKIKEQYQNSRFSIVPDGVYPEVQLAIEQRRKEMQERETLRAENKRLLAMEQQYMQALERLEFEKEQLDHEKTKLQILQKQQETTANQFDRNVSIQIEELKLHKQEIKRLQIEKEKVVAREKEIEAQANQVDEQRKQKEEEQKSVRDRILSEQASLDLQEFEALERSLTNNNSPKSTVTNKKAFELESDKQKLAMLELDILTDDLESHDKFQSQRDELDHEKRRLELMERQHKDLETNLSNQITRLQREREIELAQIEAEKERLRHLESQQTEAIKLIEIEREKLIAAKMSEQEKYEKEREVFEEAENERMRVLQKAVDEQEKEREKIEEEKQRLVSLEEKHKYALEELQRDMLTQQEKLEKERKLEIEYIEAEQLMLEELEQRQFESARQIEYETQLIKHQSELEKEEEKKRLAANERYVLELRRQQELALKQAEEERRKIQVKREEEQKQLQEEREKLSQMQEEYKNFGTRLEEEKEKLRIMFEKEKEEELARMREEFSFMSSSSNASSPTTPLATSSSFTDLDPTLLLRKRTPEGKMQQEKSTSSDVDVKNQVPNAPDF